MAAHDLRSSVRARSRPRRLAGTRRFVAYEWPITIQVVFFFFQYSHIRPLYALIHPTPTRHAARTRRPFLVFFI